MNNLTSDETSLFVAILQRTLRILEHMDSPTLSFISMIKLIDELTELNSKHNQALIVELIAKL